MSHAVNAVHTAAQVVRPEPEVEGALEPHRPRSRLRQPRVVARQRRAALLAQLLLAFAQSGPAPHGVEELEHLGQRLRALGVKTLEHLVDDDAEALVQRLLGRDPQHARELVPERAAAIRLYVRSRQRQADALSRQERTQRVLFGVSAIRRIGRPRALERACASRARCGPAARRGGAVPGLGVRGHQVLVQQRGLQDLALHWRRRREQAGVDVGECLAHAVRGRALKQGRELDELEVARDAVGDVEFGVQAQLA